MIATFMTWPYAKYDGKIQAVIAFTSDGEMRTVDLDKLKIDPDKLRKLPLM